MNEDRILRSWASAIEIMELVQQELARCERPLSAADGARIASMLQDAQMVAEQIKEDFETH